jgi:hypothetical protein
VRPLGRGVRRSMDPLHARLIEEIQLDVGHPLSLSIRPYPMLERERTDRRHGETRRFIPNRRSVAGGWRLVASRSAIAVDDLQRGRRHHRPRDLPVAVGTSAARRVDWRAGVRRGVDGFGIDMGSATALTGATSTT